MADNKTPSQLAQQRVREQRSQNYFNMLSLNEGNKPKVYKDSKGNRTIGIGFNLEDAGNRKFLKQQGIDINELFAGRELTDRETKTLYNYSLTQAFKDAQSYVVITKLFFNILNPSFLFFNDFRIFIYIFI